MGKPPPLDPVLPQACSSSRWEKSFPLPLSHQQRCHRQEMIQPSCPFPSLAFITLTLSLLVSTSSRHGVRRETPQHVLSSSWVPALPLTYLDWSLDTEGAPEPRASFPRASPSVSVVAPSALTCCPQLTSFVPQEAGELYNRMLKRFRQEKAVWVKYGAFLLRRGKAEASHRVMQRALECLPKKERECSFLPPT